MKTRGYVAAVAFVMAGAAAAAQDYTMMWSDDGGSNFIVTAVSDTDVYAGTLPAPDPTLNLIVGKRYSITVMDIGHPVEIISKSSNFVNDVILLAQTGTGSLEGDSEINWVEAGNTVTFTVTQGLVTAMRAGGNVPGYRCTAHPSAMRGDFDVFGAGVDIPDPIPAPIPQGSITIELQTIASGFISPIGMAVPDDNSDRIFVYDQNGQVHTLINGVVQSQLFLDVSDRLVSPLGTINGVPIGFDERGLLGLALHPNFATNGKIYTYTSEPVAGTADFSTITSGTPDHQSVIAEWTVSTTDTMQIDVSTRREILRIDQPQFNHNSGQLAFGPDGFLYIGFGDGGGRDDEDGNNFIGGDITDGHGPNGNGQNTETILATIVRIEVDGNTSANGQYAVPAGNPFVGTDGIDEIFAYGFRNPFRFTFDTDGTLYVADVGQGDIEEIDIVTAGGNYGWPLKEGSFFFDRMGPNVNGTVVTEPVLPIPAGVVDPIAEFDHTEGISIIGGHVYRGTALPDLVGKYVFGDFQGIDEGLGRLFYLDTGNVIKEFQLGINPRDLGEYIKGFGIDLDGEIYLFTSDSRGPAGNGTMYKLVLPVLTSARGWQLYE